MTPVTFHSAKGTKMPAELLYERGRKATIQIEGDPFPVEVEVTQVSRKKPRKGKLVPATKSATAKELRNKAKELGIADYEDMTKAELVDAIESVEDNGDAPKATKKKAAKKTKPKKATAKKSKAKKKKAETDGDEEEEVGDNPFRANTNLWHITEALMEGGKRSALVKKLRKKLKFNPRKQDPDELDVDEEIDRRLKVVGYILKNQHGFELEHEGRGSDAYIKATPPS